MNQTIKAVLFDLGDTLMYSQQPWAPVFQVAGRKLSNMLCSNGIKVNCDTFDAAFLQRLDEYYTDRDRNLLETSTIVVLQELLKENGQFDVQEDLLRAALDEFYAVTQQNWHLEVDAIPTLASLKHHGFQLGLLSNAGDDRDVFQLVEKFGISQYFDFLLTSAACGYRKPHPHIFELALTHWEYMPDEIAMVGDRLDADIGGAGPLGMYTIWIKHRAKNIKSSRFSANPNVIIENLGEITPILLGH